MSPETTYTCMDIRLKTKNKSMKAIQQKPQSLESGTEKTIFMSKKVKLDPCLTHYTKTHSEWITNLNVKHKTIKHLEKEVLPPGIRQGFFTVTPKA